MADDAIQNVETMLGPTPSLESLDQSLDQSLDSATIGLPSSVAPVQQPAAIAEPQAADVNVINPEQKLVSIPSDQLAEALKLGYKVATSEEVRKYEVQLKYGTGLEQAKTALEGAAAGATFGLSTAAEEALGVDPEGIRGRREANPITHALGEAAGFAASAAIGVGEGAVALRGGAALSKAAGLGAIEAGAKGAIVDQLGASAIKGAFESAIFQGGDEVSKMFMQDPNQSAEIAAADIGLATVIGGVFGGALGAAAAKLKKPAPTPTFVSQVDTAALEAGDLVTSVKTSNILSPKEKESILAGLGREKVNAKEIKAAANEIGAPVLEGIISDSRAVQMAEDALINGAPTYSGLRRQQAYNEAYKAVNTAADAALGAGSQLSKAEIGNAFKSTITQDLKAQNEPIAAMYTALKQKNDIIPLPKNAGVDVVKALNEIPEIRISPSSPEGALAKRVLNEIENLKTVDDVKTYKSILNRSLSPTASSGEKRMASIISDKLADLEENAIEAFAKNSAQTPEEKAAILRLVQDRKAANAEYKQFITKVKTLSEQLGKGRVYGLQDALHFINEKLTPEQVTTRLFSKNNSEFLKFFQKEFPTQFKTMQDYQKGVLRESATKDGVLSAKTLFSKIDKLEPEIQQSLFTPEELRKINAAKTYLDAFPKKFNPSGTSHADAFKEFFQHGMVGGAIANARDIAIESFIKLASMSPDVNNARILGKATVSGFNQVAKASKAVFNPLKTTATSAIATSAVERSRLDKLVTQYQVDPSKLISINDNNPVEQYNVPFSALTSRAVTYLASLKPNTGKAGPLDSNNVPNSTEMAAYNRQLGIAQNPMIVMQNVKQGTIIPQDIVTLKTIYPSLYDRMNQQLMNDMINFTSKGQMVPYHTRLGLSMFLGQPLDSTLSPASIQNAQPMQQQQQSAVSAPQKVTVKGGQALQKMSQGYQTGPQSRQAGIQKRNN